MVMSVAIEQPGSYNWILGVYGKLGMKQLACSSNLPPLES
jgi:hypothetical protein